MFKLPNLPSAQAENDELADFAELMAWDRGLISAREILGHLGRLDDNDNNIGCDDNDDENADEIDEVMNEIDRRASACGNGYPFVLDPQGTVLRYASDAENSRAHAYRYLLLSTRLNMKDCRVHAGINGSHLLEELAAEALRCYLGRSRARRIVFGTAAPGSFEDKVNHLCRELGEGGCFRNRDAVVDANDDKLDVVAWVPFSDRKSSQLIVFGQCKTGSTWRDHLSQLQPEKFIKRWMNSSYSVDPVRAFCISESANRAKWEGYALYAGLFFDRCRIVDFCDDLDPELIERIKTWSEAAKSTISLG